MENVTLVRGECSVCHGPIDKEWAGESPSLGTSCRDCFSSRDEIFGPDNVELNVGGQTIFDPLLGRYEYSFDWRGTKVMVNGEVGEVQSTQADGGYVKFPGGNSGGTFVSGLSYWRLMNIYAQVGGEMNPPVLDLPEHTPQRAELLDEPICPVTIKHENGELYGVEVGNYDIGKPDFPFYSTLHGFCNLYVRWKFGLAPNYCAEGGFIGSGFEIRNYMSGSMGLGNGLSVRTHSVRDDLRGARTFQEIRHVVMTSALENMLYQREQSRDDVAVTGADAWNVVTAWAHVMSTLLRYDWREEKYETIEDVWRCYCLLQDVLLNLIDPVVLKASLDYARDNQMVHAGSRF